MTEQFNLSARKDFVFTRITISNQNLISKSMFFFFSNYTLLHLYSKALALGILKKMLF